MAILVHFFFIELLAFDKSTSRTASQVWSSYIACIACMMDSDPDSYQTQTCSDPINVLCLFFFALQLLFQLYNTVTCPYL